MARQTCAPNSNINIREPLSIEIDPTEPSLILMLVFGAQFPHAFMLDIGAQFPHAFMLDIGAQFPHALLLFIRAQLCLW